MRILRNSEVSKDMGAWAKALEAAHFLRNPLGTRTDRVFDGRLIVAQVDTHTNGTATNPAPHPHPGITLYDAEADEGIHAPLLPYVEGIDVSAYQTNLDWAKIAASGKRFVYVKASGGSRSKALTGDAMFANHAHAAADAGLLVGAYHYLSPAVDPLEQAKRFLDCVAGAVWPLALPLVMDLEEGNGLAPDAVANAAAAFLDYVDSEFSKPVLYTMPGFFNSLPDLQWSRLARLWVAHWTSASEPMACKGFAGWDLWQYTASGAVPGWAGKADVNRFRGDESALLDWASA
jgi:GH25 family lysozyme M1 (1,4-beta-N-acetylmuramidase)